MHVSVSPVSVSFILKFFYMSTKCFLLQAELLNVLNILLQALPCAGTLSCVHILLPTGDILGTGQHLIHCSTQCLWYRLTVLPFYPPECPVSCVRSVPLKTVVTCK